MNSDSISKASLGRITRASKERIVARRLNDPVLSEIVGVELILYISKQTPEIGNYYLATK